MNFISENIDKLPAAIVLPLAIILVLIPVVKFLVEMRNSNRSHDREMLQQIAHHLEKYVQDQNKVSSFFIEEAARSRYGVPLLLSEILYFIDKRSASHELYDYSLHKPYVAIKKEKISLLSPETAICNSKILNFTWKELKGYASYLMFGFIGTMLIMVVLPLPAIWTILKWFGIVFFMGSAVYKIITTDNMRDARKYVEAINMIQPSTEDS